MYLCHRFKKEQIMTFKQEIEQSLEQIRTLEECFRQARNSEILPISFFSTSYDIVRELAGTLHFIEQEQLKFMQEQFIANKISFLETTDMISKTKQKDIIPSDHFNREIKEALADVKKEEIISIEKTVDSSKKTDEILSDLPTSLEEQLKDSFFPEEKVEKIEEKIIAEKIEEKEIRNESKILADARKYMSLNDKFRFQREIFMGSAEEMNKVLDILNGFSSLEDTWSFIEGQPWNNDSEIIIEFKEFIEKRFT